jgi:predicted TIM-barrel fold metal-dependent hydrolase
MNYGRMNDYNAFCQRQYPDKFTGLFQADEPMANTPRWMQELDRARNQLGLRGIYYQLDTFSRYGFQWSFDDSRFHGFWETLASMRIPVFFEATSIPNYDAASYIANMQRLDGLLTRFPAMRWLLVMGPPVQFFARHGTWQFPDEVARTYGRENLQMEIMFPITWGGVWDYPYPEAQALIQDLRDRYGAHKLIWGSDMPNVERFCTYRQSLDYVLKYCEFLATKEKELILGGNVADLCGIGQ